MVMDVGKVAILPLEMICFKATMIIYKENVMKPRRKTLLLSPLFCKLPSKVDLKRLHAS